MEYQNYLKLERIRLLELTQCNEIVITYCKEKDILGTCEISALNAQEDKVKRNYNFWNIIETRSDCWEHLIDIFRRTKQNTVANLLEKGTRDDGRKTAYNIISLSKPLKVDVNKRALQQGDVIYNINDGYRLDPDNIGLALLINVTEFEDEKENRLGAERDFKYMKELWSQMGYEVHPYSGRFTSDAIEEIIEDFLGVYRKKQNPGSCVVFLGSHGKDGYLKMSDDGQVQIYEDIIRKFHEEGVLDGKPKLFFIQACKYFPEGEAAGRNALNNLKDTLVCFSTLPGEGANRQEKLGSYFVHILTEVFMREAYQKEIKDLLSEVCQTMIKVQSAEEKTQVPYFLPYELKPLYFNLVTKCRNG